MEKRKLNADEINNSSKLKLNKLSGENQLNTVDFVKELGLFPDPGYKEQLLDHKLQAHNPSCSELEELEHLIVHISYQVEQMLTKFQWLRGVDVGALASTPNTLTQTLLSKYRVRLACMIVQQYWQKSIPIFDDLMSVRRQINLSMLPQVRSGELSLEGLDELQALILKNTFDSIKTMKRRSTGDSKFYEKTKALADNVRENETSREIAEAVNVKSSKKWPPPLPPIEDQNLLNQVFTHKSAVADVASNSKVDLLHIHNERLEFKGDSVLDFIVCDMLYSAFPNEAEGPLSIMKASLVCNDTLFDLSVAYKLHERLKISSDLHSKIFGEGVPTGVQTLLPDATRKNKAVADVLEAYIAGVAISQGMHAAQSWLRDLFKPLLEGLSGNRASKDINKDAKNELYRKIGSVDQRITYESLNNDSPFTVVCKINGKEIGKGVDRTVKLASLKAAENVLSQPNLVELYAAKRRETPKTAPSTGDYRKHVENKH